MSDLPFCTCPGRNGYSETCPVHGRVSDQDRTIPERPPAQRWWEYNPAQTVTEAVPDDDDEQRLGWRQW